MFTSTFINSPVGQLKITASKTAITAIEFCDKSSSNQQSPSISNTILEKAVIQIKEYLAGTRQIFDLPLDPQGTVFQKKVWQALQKIPYGNTVSYKKIAQAIDNPKASRAVGNANNKNPIPIIIPCHRVIGANGSLVGYAGGLHFKEFLLNHENKFKDN